MAESEGARPTDASRSAVLQAVRLVAKSANTSVCFKREDVMMMSLLNCGGGLARSDIRIGRC